MKRTAVVVIGALVILLGIFVWPTQWRYDELRQGRDIIPVRTNRFTSRVEKLSTYGWATMIPLGPDGYPDLSVLDSPAPTPPAAVQK